MENNINKKDIIKSMDNKPKFDHISNRIDFIHNLLKDKKLDPLIDVKVPSLEISGGSETTKKEQQSKDMRTLLHKKAFEHYQLEVLIQALHHL